MSYFIMSSNNINKVVNSQQDNKNLTIDFEDIKIYSKKLSEYNKNISKNIIIKNEITEIFKELKIELSKINKIFFIEGINYLKESINKDFIGDKDNYNIIYIENINYDIKIKPLNTLLFRIDKIVDTNLLQYIYNLLVNFNEIIVYNCYISQISSFCIYIICINYNNYNITLKKNFYFNYIFYINFKNIYYQIIQKKLNILNKKNSINIELWNNLYL